MAFLIYNTLIWLLSPLIAVFILYRVLISKNSKDSWVQQIGFPKINKDISSKNPVWIHAVSVGESVASADVVSLIKEKLPEVPIVLSTTTQTGQKMAEKSIKNADAFIYYPFDIALCVSSAIKKVNPKVFSSTDTEIWPNFRQIARARGVKNAIINGTVSDATMKGAKLLPWLYRWTLSNIDLFCMQSQADADNIISIGADNSKVMVTGNIKADVASIKLSEEEISELLGSYFPIYKVRPRIFIAGSTNPGEDEPVLDAYLIAKKEICNLKLIIAPRQIERRAEIAEFVSKKGLRCAWKSQPETITGEEDVVILDTFGELAKAYFLADVSFVGGSLIPRGCHSILQPIAAGKPVFFGPYTFKAKDLTAQAKAAGIGFQIADGKELGKQITQLLLSPQKLNLISQYCSEMMAKNAGASQRTADALVELYNQSL